MTQMRPGVLSGAMSPYPTVEKVTYARERWGVKLKGQCLDGNSEVIPLTMTNQKASKKLRFSSPSDLLKRCSDGEKLQRVRVKCNDLYLSKCSMPHVAVNKMQKMVTTRLMRFYAGTEGFDDSR